MYKKRGRDLQKILRKKNCCRNKMQNDSQTKKWITHRGLMDFLTPFGCNKQNQTLCDTRKFQNLFTFENMELHLFYFAQCKQIKTIIRS